LAALEARVEAQRHHPPQTGAITSEQLDDRLSIAGSNPGDEIGHLARGGRHVTKHKNEYCQTQFARDGLTPILPISPCCTGARDDPPYS
jgi:hypothetical protein